MMLVGSNLSKSGSAVLTYRTSVPIFPLIQHISLPPFCLSVCSVSGPSCKFYAGGGSSRLGNRSENSHCSYQVSKLFGSQKIALWYQHLTALCSYLVYQGSLLDLAGQVLRGET